MTSERKTALKSAVSMPYKRQTKQQIKYSSFQPAGSSKAAAPYVREISLPRLIAIWPSDLKAMSKSKLEKIVNILKKALRAERQKGLVGHWSYNINRHLALLQAYQAEREALKNDSHYKK
ncbi:MAG: hypothetical protein AAF228_07465 [Pseudomonadota bacterium]